ncbi:GNAT family N-acetyltransferase [Criblamydia sequanensis]|uniref:Acetyltransferase, GNAT family n=1 Tax=Candidatus Criblamydia sequanensis CRIB-18 TaxID=1437425 RepID=A0A090D2D0_9BACT|nr:GNAT family N-acetyltransferase [Criblamydia sequanensis]CDR34228.1 Acetyltransferase, GNAT family [Criblamydia sequanensis CRIB-18]
MPLSIIREMQEEDIKSLVDNFCFPWSSLQATNHKWQQYYKEHQNQMRTVYLLEYEGEIIGYGSLLHASDYSYFEEAKIPEINDVWISEKWRRKGFGKKLILYIENEARKKGYPEIGLGVGLYADYGNAQKLYFQLGYKANGKGITYKTIPVIPGEKYAVDDDLVLWLTKVL